MRHLVLELVEPREIKFFPGQYLDIAVPGTDETRSFSMANTSSRDSGQLEFVIRVYPDGLFSHFLDTGLTVGDRLDITGPFGVFTLREGRDSDLIFIGGGAGMAPILCLLRSLVERGISRKATYYYGARRRAGPVLREGAASPRGDAAGFPLRAGAVGVDRRRRLGGRGRLHHRRRAAARGQARRRRRVRVWPTTDGRGGHRRCSLIWAYRRNASTTTSSPRLVKPIPLQQ